MRVKSLELVNFRSYQHLRIDFTEPRTLVVGENGVGKSTVVDAIALALTGRCRGVNGKGEGQKELIYTGATEAKITLCIEGQDPIVRTIHAKHGATSNRPPEMIMGALRTTEPMLAAAIYGSTFFDLHHADAKALVMKLLNVRVPVPADKQRTEGGTELVDLDELDRRYKIAFEDRATTKRDLAAVVVPDVQKPSDLTDLADVDPVKRLGDDLERARNAYAAVVNESADRRAGWDELQRRLKMLNADVMDPAVTQTKIDLHREQVARYEDEQAQARTRLDALTANQVEPVDTLGGRVQELKLFVQRIEAGIGPTTAPAKGKTKKASAAGLASCVLGAGIPCMTPVSEFHEAIGRARTDIKALDARIRAGTKLAEDIGAARQDLQSAERNKTYHDGQIADLTKRLDVSREAAAGVESVKALLLELKPQIDADQGKVDERRCEMDACADRLTSLKWYQQQLGTREKAVERRTALQVRLDDLEAAVRLFGPTGARVQALESALADFHQAINAALAPFGFTMTIQVDPWVVKVKHGRTNAPVSFDLLSKGQKVWTGAAFQLALAAVSGLGFVVVDDVDGVVGTALRMLTALVMTSPVAQVLVVKAQANDQATPQMDGLQVVRLSEGQPSAAA